MRCLFCTLGLVLFVVSFAGCRTPATGVSNPFLSPDRVPPPATRTQLPGTAQPYYQGDPLPNTSINSAPQNYQPAPTFAPQPAGVVPPGGWNTTPQPYPGGASLNGVLPGNIQPVNAVAPIQVQPDQFDLRFAQPPPYQPLNQPSLMPVAQQGVSAYQDQLVSYEAPIAQPIAQPIIAQPMAEPRQVRIRAISSDGFGENGQTAGRVPSSDGFRPQGSSLVRKPTTGIRRAPRGPVREASDRFGFAPGYEWLRGQLQLSSATGQWTLRYVPIQGSVDPFGGNLTIANPQVLSNLQPGDFVLLRGRLDGTEVGAPIYTVSVVQRQRI